MNNKNEIIINNYCPHENVKIIKWYEDGYEVEKLKRCNDCGSVIYHFSYGQDLLAG